MYEQCSGIGVLPAHQQHHYHVPCRNKPAKPAGDHLVASYNYAAAIDNAIKGVLPMGIELTRIKHRFNVLPSDSYYSVHGGTLYQEIRRVGSDGVEYFERVRAVPEDVAGKLGTNLASAVNYD